MRKNSQEVFARHVEVIPKSGDSPDKVVRKFIRKVRNDGILQEVKLRQAYEKPSDRRRRKQARSEYVRKTEEFAKK